MSKFLLSVSFLCVSFLLFFSMKYPGNPVMWLASTSQSFVIIRISLMASLLLLLGFRSFINVPMRSLIGLLTAGLLGYTLWETYSNAIGLVDTLVLLMASMSTLIAVLESAHPRTKTSLAPAAVPTGEQRFAAA